MKSILRVLLVFAALGCSGVAFADTWTVASEVKSMPAQSASYDGICYRRVWNYVAQTYSGVLTFATADVRFNAVNVNPSTHSGPQSFKYRQEYGYKTNASTFVPVVWFDAYNQTVLGVQTDNVDGTVVGGVYYNSSTGFQMDEFTGDDVPPPAFEKTINLENLSTVEKTFKVVIKDMLGATIVEEEVNVPPGTTLPYKVRSDEDFTVEVSEKSFSVEFPEGYVWGTPVVHGGDPSYTGTVPTGTNSGAAPNPTPTAGTQPAAVANVTRPGTVEGNADARNSEIRSELQRLGTIAQNAADKAHMDSVNQSNKLKGIDESIDALNSNGDGVSPLSGPAPGDAGDFATDSVGAGAGISSGVGTLGAALGVGGLTGSAALAWTLPTPFGTVVLNAEEYATYFDYFRIFMSWLVSCWFVFRIIGLIKWAVS